MERTARALTTRGPIQEYIKKRDYTGASALLEFNRKAGDENEVESLLWIGYCSFHLTNYQRGAKINTAVPVSANSRSVTHQL